MDKETINYLYKSVLGSGLIQLPIWLPWVLLPIHQEACPVRPLTLVELLTSATPGCLSTLYILLLLHTFCTYLLWVLIIINSFWSETMLLSSLMPYKQNGHLNLLNEWMSAMWHWLVKGRQDGHGLERWKRASWTKRLGFASGDERETLGDLGLPPRRAVALLSLCTYWAWCVWTEQVRSSGERLCPRSQFMPRSRNDISGEWIESTR